MVFYLDYRMDGSRRCLSPHVAAYIDQYVHCQFAQVGLLLGVNHTGTQAFSAIFLPELTKAGFRHD